MKEVSCFHCWNHKSQANTAHRCEKSLYSFHYDLQRFGLCLTVKITLIRCYLLAGYCVCLGLMNTGVRVNQLLEIVIKYSLICWLAFEIQVRVLRRP